jgi:hypothetical protein
VRYFVVVEVRGGAVFVTVLVFVTVFGCFPEGWRPK